MYVYVCDDFIFPSLINLLPLFSLGVMGSLGHYFISQAAKRADTVVITPFEYSAFIWVIIMGYIFAMKVFWKMI